MRDLWKWLACRVRGHRWVESPVPDFVRHAVAAMRPDAAILGNRECARCGVMQLKLEVPDDPEGGRRGRP